MIATEEKLIVSQGLSILSTHPVYNKLKLVHRFDRYHQTV